MFPTGHNCEDISILVTMDTLSLRDILPLPISLHVTMSALLLFCFCHWEPKSYNIMVIFLGFFFTLNSDTTVELKNVRDKSNETPAYCSKFGKKQMSKSH